VTILQDAKDMNLGSKTRTGLEANGIKAATSFLVPKASYQVP
jgi:hypothetical protein